MNALNFTMHPFWAGDDHIWSCKNGQDLIGRESKIANKVWHFGREILGANPERGGYFNIIFK